MSAIRTRLDLYRSLYWANQGLLNAGRYSQETEGPASSTTSKLVNHNLRRTQAMIEETPAAINQILGEWAQRTE